MRAAPRSTHRPSRRQQEDGPVTLRARQVLPGPRRVDDIAVEKPPCTRHHQVCTSVSSQTSRSVATSAVLVLSTTNSQDLALKAASGAPVSIEKL